jgi:hypothetical protein
MGIGRPEHVHAKLVQQLHGELTLAMHPSIIHLAEAARMGMFGSVTALRVILLAMARASARGHYCRETGASRSQQLSSEPPGRSSREGVVLGCFIHILIVPNDMYQYLVIRHVGGLILFCTLGTSGSALGLTQRQNVRFWPLSSGYR